MNEWRYQMRRKKRGEHCLVVHPGQGSGTICGCGNRTPPPKHKKTRIVKRAVARQLSDLVEEATR